jgi:hypothetical protein
MLNMAHNLASQLLRHTSIDNLPYFPLAWAAHVADWKKV